MNRRGQALITFVLMLPFIIFFLAFFIDSVYGRLEKSKLDGIITSNMKIACDNNIRDIDIVIKAIKENNSALSVDAELVDNLLKINVSGEKKNIFGNIFQTYDFKFNYCIDYNSKKINKDCG